MKTIFTAKDKGCWIDGAFDPEHARDKMIEMIKMVPKSDETASLLIALDNGGYFIDEIADDVTELLSEFTQDMLYWIWEAGDLILTDETED